MAREKREPLWGRWRSCQYLNVWTRIGTDSCTRWPADRPWNAADDNIGPCGSKGGPTNRTIYPLSQGSVALSIADDAYHVAFRLAVKESP